MDTKTYENVTVKKEEDSVILSTPSMTRPLIMSRGTFRTIVAANVKEGMRGNSEPGQTITQIFDSVTPWEEV